MVGVTKDEVVVVVLIMIISSYSVNSLGKRSFGESCSIGGHITSFFSQEREEKTCDSDMGLICTGTCNCPPGRVWDFSDNDFGFTDRSKRGCALGAGTPCIGSSRNQQCVSNAHCQFAFCRCKTGFKQNGRQCVSTNGEDEDPSQARPASTSSISFPELQQIFSGFGSQFNNHQLNNFNNNDQENRNDRFNLNNENSFNDRFASNFESNNNDRFATNFEGNNDRFATNFESNNNERFPTSPNVENYYNDRFLVNPDENYHDHQNSRDGSRGSGIRFEE